MLKTFSVIAVNGGVLDSAANNQINGHARSGLKLSKIALLEDRLNYIIDFRHGIIHRMEVDHRVTKSQVDDIFITRPTARTIPCLPI